MVFQRLLKNRFNRAVLGRSQDQQKGIGPPAPLDAFVSWLIAAQLTYGLDRRSLLLAYGEFCLDTNSEHLSEGQLLRRVRTVGIERYRESVGKRRWRYRVSSETLTRLGHRPAPSQNGKPRETTRSPPT